MSDRKKENILVVDDSLRTLKMIRLQLESHNYSVFTASSVDEALNILKDVEILLVISDLKMPKLTGIDFLKKVKEKYHNISVIMITGYPSVDTAVKALKLGACEYLSKPFKEEELIQAVEFAFQNIRNKKFIDTSLEKLTNDYFGIIGNHKTMKKVFDLIDRASKVKATVLITGASGTGKELVARAIHYKSSNKSSPFVAVNCSAIPEPLLESELFGYVKGAFTGANDTRAGFFQISEKGTIFLDEISSMPLSLQVKLLRVLQNKEICMVGSRKITPINVRVIAASNKDLTKLIKEGKFREDLYYRLNVLPIDLPSLIERSSDILLLAKFFTNKYAKELKRKVPKFSEEVLRAFKKYSWPGNVRELENLIQQLLIISDTNNIEISDLPYCMRNVNISAHNNEKTLKEIEQEHILRVLNLSKGNKSKASKILGIDRKTLIKKVKEHELRCD